MRGESFEDCARRIAEKELGVKNARIIRNLGFFENLEGDPRGHIHHLVVSCEVEGTPHGQWFARLPDNLIPYQKDFLTQLGFS